MNELILAAQRLGNEITGFGIGEDGIYGPQTKKMIIGVLQWAMNKDYGAGLDVDGIWGPASEGAIAGHYVKFGETQYMVTALEIGVMAHGYNAGGVEQPGVFGSGLQNTVLNFQRDSGITADGIAGYDTFHALIKEAGGGGVPIADYDPDNLPNFGRDEFKCECGCGFDVCDELKIRAQMLRDKIGMPMTITSGARCPSQNARDGGVPDSLHTCGEAFDFQVYHDDHYQMEDDMQDRFREYAHAVGLQTGNYYGSGGGWMHCQIGGSDFNRWP